MPPMHTDLLEHRAAQYLASFGKQYIPRQDDDSHTNIAWDSSQAALRSRITADDQQLSLFLEDLRLSWTKGELAHSLLLQNRTHGEICVWLHHIALRFDKEEYDFHLHYKLDSGRIIPDDNYNDYDLTRAQELITLRNQAQSSCEEIVKAFKLSSEVRIWPHHFDTGAYGDVPGSGVQVGFGMAIPDTVVDDYYFYVSGYRDGKAISTEGFTELELGKWYSGDFKGAILPVNGTSSEDQISFFKQGIESLTK
jgi:hypothetical protein